MFGEKTRKHPIDETSAWPLFRLWDFVAGGLPWTLSDAEFKRNWMVHLGGFHGHGGTPQNGWSLMENPNLKWIRLRGTTILGNLPVKLHGFLMFLQICNRLKQ